jgi:DNA polymerase I-like protein with 3'-5' exonuclease and polymerase domains
MIDITVDLETTANGPGNSPEAHYKNNKIILCGHQPGTQPVVIVRPDANDLMRDIIAARNDNKRVRLIGHNLKFDLKYLMREFPAFKWSELDYHCTMYGEYALSGHMSSFMSMEAACAKRGIPFAKTLDLGALIKKGIKMEDIDIGELTDYLRGDVVTTYKLFVRQTQEDGTLHANHTLPLAAMELNGLPLNVAVTRAKMSDHVNQEALYSQHLFAIYARYLEWDDGTQITPPDIKLTAPRTISYLLTGEPSTGLVKGKRAIKFKSGMTCLLTAASVAKLWGPKAKPNHLGYTMTASQLSKVAIHMQGSAYIDQILKLKKVQKIMGTYLGPFLEEAKVQDTIHPKLNMCQTRTGRLSSSKPNGQNLPEVARECFKSTNGWLHEIDFKQLEIVALAAISGCPDLNNDLALGEDIHYNTGKRVFGWKHKSDMSEKDRKSVKAVNFGLIYGGGAAGLSLTTGMSKKLVKELIDAFYVTYPGVAKWQEDFYKEVTSTMKAFDLKDGEQRYCSMVTLPVSNRRFFFYESESPGWLRARTGRKWSFKPTETKNYPVQGFAGGDIVMLACILLYRRLATENSTLMRMTVHDSILVDTYLSANQMQAMMDDVSLEIQSIFNMSVSPATDITSGKHWQ